MSLYRSITSIADKLLPNGAASSLRNAVRSRRVRQNKLENDLRRVTWQQSAGENKALSIEIQPGITFAAHTDSELCRLIYVGGYELEERQFVYRFLKQGDVFADIGANVGLYSLIASRAVASGKVYAFEPCSSTYSRLLDNIGNNGMSNIHSQQVAVSDSDGELEIFASTGSFDAWNSASRPAAGTQFRQELVRCIKWDSFTESENIRGKVALAKVDIEGWEGHFLAGGARELASPDAPVLLMELNDDATESAGTSVDEIRRQLSALGYLIYCPNISDGELRLFPFDMNRRRSSNVIALKNPEAVLRRVRHSPPHNGMR